MNRNLLLSINSSWNVANFRSGLISAIRVYGLRVVAAAPVDEHVSRIEDMGCGFAALPMDKTGTNPVRDAALFVRYLRLFRRERPAIYLGFTPKPNIYGSLAAHLLGIPVINNVAGLGTAFIRGGWLNRVVKLLYRVALSRSRTVFFQNNEDLDLFVREGLVRVEVARLLPGSGVDTARFSPQRDEPLSDRPFRFLLVARMLGDKGVREYVEAARLLRTRYDGLEFQLLGFVDSANPTAISAAEMKAWCDEGVVRYFGEALDVRPHLAAADCVVLPSYREGTPRSLLEAAAMGKPIVTTDAVGCREVVDDGVNGYLCRVRDAKDLAEKLEQLYCLSPEARAAMGAAGRAKVVCEFDEQIVIDRYLEAIRVDCGITSLHSTNLVKN